MTRKPSGNNCGRRGECGHEWDRCYAGKTPLPEWLPSFTRQSYKAILLYGSETWNLTKAALARLEGFHIRAAYKMARVHRPRQGAHGLWQYPKSADVLEECGMYTIAEYILVRRQMIAVYVADRPILENCRQGNRQRGSMPRQWWWEQPMELDAPLADPAAN